MRSAASWLLRGGVLGGIAFVIFGPILNLILWAVAEIGRASCRERV